jgi:hypothetical protein
MSVEFENMEFLRISSVVTCKIIMWVIMRLASSGHAEYQHSDQQIQVHGPAERGSSGVIAAPQLQELGAWFLARLRKPVIHSLNERKQKASCGNEIVLHF